MEERHDRKWKIAHFLGAALASLFILPLQVAFQAIMTETGDGILAVILVSIIALPIATVGLLICYWTYTPKRAGTNGEWTPNRANTIGLAMSIYGGANVAFTAWLILMEIAQGGNMDADHVEEWWTFLITSSVPGAVLCVIGLRMQIKSPTVPS